MIRVLLGAPLGLLVGLSLGALGGGGSILAVPVLVFVIGLDARAGTTSSLVVVAAASAAGLIGHYRGGRVKLLPGLAFGVAGVGGSFAGASLSSSIDPNLLLLAFSFVMVAAAWRMWVTRPSASSQAAAAEAPRQTGALWAIGKVLIAGTFVGFMTGLFGVGGGFVIVPALVLALGYAMPVAVGTSLLVIVVNSIVALAVRLHASSVDWMAVLPFAGAALAGSALGTKLTRRFPARRLVSSFVVLLIAVALYTGIRSALAL